MGTSVSFEDDESQLEAAAIGNGAEVSTATEPGPPDGVDRLPKDVVFGLLSNERRRLVLNYLTDEEEATTLSHLAEHIASIENDKPVGALASDERKRVYVCLYQSHLPKMADANVIDYNQARGTVELRPEADQLLGYLTGNSNRGDREGSGIDRLLPDRVRGLVAGLIQRFPGREVKNGEVRR